MRLLVGAALAAVFATTALAQGTSSMKVAMDLGMVLASEEPCGMTYDQAAIAAFIESNVPADDMGFSSSLSMMTTGSSAQIETMTSSAKTAHCTQIKRVAKTYNFVGE